MLNLEIYEVLKIKFNKFMYNTLKKDKSIDKIRQA